MKTTEQTEKASAARIAHTPGPWARDGVTVFADLGDGINACDIAVMINDGVLPLAQKEANACLIAAAPDLLEACKLAKSTLNVNGHTEQERAGAVRICNAAIAKAEGRQP